MRFITNLRPQSRRAFADSGYLPQAWLLSSHRLSAQTADLAADVRAEGLDLFADNGTKPMIDDVLEQFAEPAAALRKKYTQFKRSQPAGRRVPYMTEIPAELRSDATTLAAAICAHVDNEWAAIEQSGQLDLQLSMDPTHLIAKEDFAIGALLGLGLERELLGWSIGRYDTRNRRTIEGWHEAVAVSDPEIVVYATLAACDYHTARHAGRIAAEAGVTAVAVGFAGLNKDMTYTDCAFLVRRRHLQRPGPRRYVRVVEIMLGLVDGYGEMDADLGHFHALGLGSRSQFPLLPTVLGPRTEISVDATSPLHDAIRDRVLYDPEAYGKRVSLVAGAERALAGEADRVPDGPFLAAAATELGHDPADARRWWESQDRRQVSWADLVPGEPVATAMPVYASGRGGSTSFQESRWVAHNHWAVDELTREISGQEAAQTAAWLEALSTASSVTVRNGVTAALEVIELHRGTKRP